MKQRARVDIEIKLPAVNHQRPGGGFVRVNPAAIASQIIEPGVRVLSRVPGHFDVRADGVGGAPDRERAGPAGIVARRERKVKAGVDRAGEDGEGFTAWEIAAGRTVENAAADRRALDRIDAANRINGLLDPADFERDPRPLDRGAGGRAGDETFAPAGGGLAGG